MLQRDTSGTYHHVLQTTLYNKQTNNIHCHVRCGQCRVRSSPPILSLAGWVENTAAGTVRGEVCGDEPAVEQFKTWAETEGAPKAKPHHAEFSMAKEVDRAEAEKLFPKGFEVRRTLLSNGKQWA